MFKWCFDHYFVVVSTSRTGTKEHFFFFFLWNRSSLCFVTVGNRNKGRLLGAGRKPASDDAMAVTVCYRSTECLQFKQGFLIRTLILAGLIKYCQVLRQFSLQGSVSRKGRWGRIKQKPGDLKHGRNPGILKMLDDVLQRKLLDLSHWTPVQIEYLGSLQTVICNCPVWAKQTRYRYGFVAGLAWDRINI